MGKVRPSKYRLDIRPCAHIHDAQYYLIRDNIDTILYTNKHLVKAVQWQDHPLIQHDEVKLGGELSIFYPDWSKELTIPNEVSEHNYFLWFKTYSRISCINSLRAIALFFILGNCYEKALLLGSWFYCIYR